MIDELPIFAVLAAFAVLIAILVAVAVLIPVAVLVALLGAFGRFLGLTLGGLLVTVADMVMGVGSGHATGIRWPHPTVSLSTEFVRGARLGQWLEGSARVARRTVNFCFCSCDLVCGGEIVLVASGVFKVPDVDKIPEAVRATVMGRWGEK